MDERTKRIEELFRLGVVVPRAERPDFLKRHCGGDESLEAELAALLAQDDDGTKSYLSSPVISRWRKGDTSRAEDPRATLEVLDGHRTERIGRYTVLHELGEGGMGMVYLAEQSAPVKRRVALKVVKLGMDTRRVVARFDRERQALALMDHPGIARIFDGGTTESGRPYFVMEYVPGAPLTDYCDDNELDVPERLELFVQVCEAMQHAHGKGIVHRDLKPSNVLVAERDGQPGPKVIDFGIARAMRDDAADGPGAERETRASEIIGTYAYMSPEQANPTGGDVDARADVYALGVMLYELLTGALPVDVDELRGKSPSEVSSALLKTDPPSPSTKLGKMGSGLHHIASCRGFAEPRALAKKVMGDLDWITLRAMERDPARRYASAAALASDVRRHLGHQAVHAGPPSLAYRARKFVRRRRVGIAAAAAILLTVASGALGTFLGFSQASQEAQVARAAETDAWVAVEAARTALAREAEHRMSLERYSNSLLDLVDLTDPEAPLRADESAVSLLSELRENVSTVYADEPRAEASVRVRIARATRMRGELELAREDLTRASELQEQYDAPTEERLETVRELHALAIDSAGYSDFSNGMSAAALEVELIGASDSDAGDAAEALLKSAAALDVDRIALDLATLEKSLPTGAGGVQARILAADLVGLTGGYLGLHLAFTEAEPLLDAALAMSEKVHGPTHPATVAALDDLVTHLYQQGKTARAADVIAKRVPAFHSRFSAEHWLRAEVDSLYGECLSLSGDPRAFALLQSSHDAILRDRGPRSGVAVHAALRLRDHYARTGDAQVPHDLVDVSASPLARSRDAKGAWLRTAETLGADEQVTEALTAIFGSEDTLARAGAPAEHAAGVLATLVANRAGTPEIGDFVARALVAVKPRIDDSSPALGHSWSDAFELAEARVQELDRRRAEALAARETARLVAEAKPPVPLDTPFLDAVPTGAKAGSAPADAAASTQEAAASSAEIALEPELALAQESVPPPSAVEGYTAEELILFAWMMGSSGEQTPAEYALALEACDRAIELAPSNPDYGVVHALALTRVGMWATALDELGELESSLGSIGFHGLAARALALDEAGDARSARKVLTQAEIKLFFFPGTLPKGMIELIIELERRLAF